jgi:hypothetical protein
MTLTKKAIITQSNYIPWKGYFDSIRHVDVFVVYDDMQYTKRDWRNRNVIKTPQGLKWLSIPVEVKGKYFQKIKDTKIAEKDWNISHWDTIKQNYKGAKHFKETSEWLEPLYRNCNFDFLTEVNIHFINAICEQLGIKTDIKLSSDFDLAEEKTQRLVNICKDIQATDYYSGPAAKAYMEVHKFEIENINVHYWDYSNYPKYEQLHGEFEHGVSIIDLLMNEGNNSITYLKQLI